MRVGKRGIILSFREFRDAGQDDLLKLLGLFHPTDKPDPAWVDEVQDEAADRTLREAQKQT